ncbi:MAG: YfiR family protein [Bryobacteraceae bacterium]
MRRIPRLILMAMAIGRGPVAAQVDSLDEVRVKAAVVLQLSRFVEWPRDTAAAPQFTICVAGKDLWIEPLEKVTHGQTVGGKRVVVRRITRPEDVPGCLVAILGPQAKQVVRAALGRTPILTIGDEQGFISAGGMIGLELENGRVAFAVSPKNARRLGIRFSSKLIRLARVPEREE